MMLKDKKKYFFAGALVLGVAVILAIVLIIRRSGKDDSVTTGKQTKELKDDPCETLLREYVKAEESGVSKEELNALYAKGAAGCPKYFRKLRNQEEPKLEDVRALLAQRLVEKKTEGGGVNTSEVKGSDLAAVNGEEKNPVGSKGSKPADPLNPATVPQTKNDTKEIISIKDEKNDALKSKSSEESDPARRLPVPQPKDSTSTKKTNPAATTSSTSTTTSTGPEDTNIPQSQSVSDNQSEPVINNQKQEDSENSEHEDASTNPTAPDTKKPLTSAELKEARTAARQECIKMINEIEANIGAENVLKGFTSEQNIRIGNLVEEGLLPKGYSFGTLANDFYKGQRLNYIKAGKDEEAQKVHDLVKSFGYESDKTALVTETNDYKFWRAIEKAVLTDATTLLDKPLFLPSFVREAMKKNPEKLKLLKALDDAQMDTLWEYCQWDKEREECLRQYKDTSDEWMMADLKAEYNNTAEKMSLLTGDIHADFDFAVPQLPPKVSFMEDLISNRLKDKPKLPEFDAAFKTLREDRNLTLRSTMDAVNKLPNREDQLELLETVKLLKKSNDKEWLLIDIMTSVGRREPMDKSIKTCLASMPDYKDVQHLAAIEETLDWTISYTETFDFMSSGRPTKECLSRLHFWKQFIILVKAMTGRLNERAGHFGTISGVLKHIATNVNLDDIVPLVNCLAEANLGTVGTELVRQFVDCCKARAEWQPNEGNKAELAFAQAYLNLYIAAKGVGMSTLFNSQPLNTQFYKGLDPVMVTDLVLSKEKLYAERGYYFDDNWKNQLMALVKATN